MTTPVAAIVALVLGVLFLVTKSVTKSGAVAGALLAFIFGLASELGPFFAFAAFVVIGTFSSRYGREKKKNLGVYQNEEGPRSWVNATANCGFGAAVILVGVVWPNLFGASISSFVAAGSLCAVCADTCASEWGTLFGGKPKSMASRREVEIGADGGVTWVGSLAGLCGAAIIAGLYVALEDLNTPAFSILLLAGAVGNIVDSLLGATVEPHLGKHGGAYVNFMCSVAGSAIAFAMA